MSQTREMVEDALMGMLITKRELFDYTTGLNAESFSGSSNRKIWDCMERLSLESGQDWDPVFLVDRMKGEVSLGTLTNLMMHAPPARRIDDYIQRVKDISIARKVRAAAMEIVKCEDDAEILGIADATLSSAMDIQDDQGPMDMASQAVEWKKQLREEAAMDGLIQTQMGFSNLDARICAKPGELIVLAGRPGTGKTTLAMQWVYNAAINQGKHGFVVSIEMMLSQMCGRLSCLVESEERRKSGSFDNPALNSIKLRDVKAFSAGDWDAIDRTAELMSDLTIMTDYVPSQSVSTIKAKARRLHRMGKLDFLMIDYLQLIEEGTGGRDLNRERQVAEMSRALKKLAKELKIPVLLLAQLNRSSEKFNRRPTKADLRESGAIEQDADWIVMLYQDVDLETPGTGIVEVLTVKARNGCVGMDTVRADFAHSRFLPVTQAEKENYEERVAEKDADGMQGGKKSSSLEGKFGSLGT